MGERPASAGWYATHARGGTSRLTPVAGTGFSAAAWQENLIAAGLIPMTLSMVVCCVLVLRGLGGKSLMEKGIGFESRTLLKNPGPKPLRAIHR